MFMVALWLPSTSHSALQLLGFIHQVHVHDEHSDAHHDADSDGSHEHGTTNHQAADGLFVFSPSKVELTPLVGVASVPWLVAVWCNAVDVPSSLTAHSGPAPPGVAPPELTHRWHFCFRAALPARAPSLVS